LGGKNNYARNLTENLNRVIQFEVYVHTLELLDCCFREDHKNLSLFHILHTYMVSTSNVDAGSNDSKTPTTVTMAMEANRDEAERCKVIGIDAVKQGDYARAVKFFRKSLSLYPLSDVEALLSKAEQSEETEVNTGSTTSPKEAANSSPAPYPPTAIASPSAITFAMRCALLANEGFADEGTFSGFDFGAISSGEEGSNTTPSRVFSPSAKRTRVTSPRFHFGARNGRQRTARFGTTTATKPSAARGGHPSDRDGDDPGLLFRMTTISKLDASLGFYRESDDLSYLINTVQSLITIIEELATVLQPRLVPNQRSGLSLSLQRVDFPSVTVKTNPSTEKVVFSTTPTLAVKEFPPLPAIPPVLMEILAFKCENQKMVPDYLHLFHMIAGLFHESVQVPALRVLKRHLDEVQVQLGQLTEWAVVEPEGATSLLNRLFSVKLTVPDLADFASRRQNSFGGPGGGQRGRSHLMPPIELMSGNQTFGEYSHVFSTHCGRDENLLENFIAFFKQSQTLRQSNIEQFAITKEHIESIKQLWIDTREGNRTKFSFLSDMNSVFTTYGSTIIFAGTRDNAAAIKRVLTSCGCTCSVIHSSTLPDEREFAMDAFRNQTSRVLVVTDGMARIDLEVQNVSLVVIFDIPVGLDGNVDYETYLERIGCLRRFGSTGFAVNLVDDDRSVELVVSIESLLSKEGKTMIRRAQADPKTLKMYIANSLEFGGTAAGQNL